MDSRTIKLACMTAAVAAAMIQMGAVQAQEAKAAATAADGLNLERVIVTGTAGGSSKMKSSVSVSTMELGAIEQGAPTSAAEVLRSIPGIRSESSGGEGNANITVRGLPVSAGGARYVQIQEDGLPVLQFGDIAFATPDSFVKIDGSLDHLEVVRGGSASTLASNAPGGIINFISKTGEEKGGSIGLTKGVNFNENRLDFDYGMPISDKTRFFIGGFYRDGEGIRNTGGQTLEKGGQIRGNITQDFDAGFVRLSFKHLDDQAPTALPVPVQVVNGNITTIAGINPRTASFYSPSWVRDISLNGNNTYTSSNVNDGLRVNTNALGLESSFKIGDGWTVTENLRKTQTSGRFIGVYPNGAVAATSGFQYATGANAGQAYTGLSVPVVVFNTSINDVGNTISDTKFAKTFQLAGGNKLTATAGLYASIQKVNLTWTFNPYQIQASGNNPSLLQPSSGSSVMTGPVGTGFVNAANPNPCCDRVINTEYKTTSPYLNLGFESGALNLDGGLRQDHEGATGYGSQASLVGGVNGVVTYPANPTQQVNYSVEHTSYSFGANYKVQSNLAVFARVSDGVAFASDRLMFSTALDGSAPVTINTVKQIEGGFKLRQGPVSTFVTLFQAKTKEGNYDATTQALTNNSYDAKGVELEMAYSAGDFRINGGATYTHATITGTAASDVATIGNAPQRQAKIVYQLVPTYELGQAKIGASIIGTGKSFADNANTLVMPAYFVVNAFSTYQINPKLQAMVSANNVFNKIGYTEVDGTTSARSVTGRAVKAGLKYSF